MGVRYAREAKPCLARRLIALGYSRCLQAPVIAKPDELNPIPSHP